MNNPKLYGLYFTKNEERRTILLACSHESRKLQEISECNKWFVATCQRGRTYWHSEDNSYPYYNVREVPIIY